MRRPSKVTRPSSGSSRPNRQLNSVVFPAPMSPTTRVMDAGASFIVADLSVMTEVRRVAAEFRAGHSRLDVLLNNAGAVTTSRQETPEGIEMTFALNHLNYFLLTQELLDLLKATPDSRVVNVSSEAHRSGRMRWDDLEFRKGYSGFQAYGQSKLANILFTRELSYRLAGTGVTANALHPGVVYTGFGQGGAGLAGRLVSLSYQIMRPFIKSEEQGAQTSIYLASSPEVAGVTGQYFDNERVARPTTTRQRRGCGPSARST